MSYSRLKNDSRSRSRKTTCVLALDFDETLAIRDSSDDYVLKLYTEFIRTPSLTNRSALTRAVFGSNKRIHDILIPLLSIKGVEYVVVSANVKYYVDQLLEASGLRDYFRYVYGSVDEKGRFIKKRFKSKLERVIFVDDHSKYINQVDSVLPKENIFKVPKPTNKQHGIQMHLFERLLKRIQKCKQEQ